MRQLNIHQSAKTLGVKICLNLGWSEQFKEMRRKLVESVKKLMNTELTSCQVHVYFNIYMLKIIFFGCGVVILSEMEEDEMKRIHENTTLNKLWLSVKFPREAIYMRKTALGLGLLEPNTVVSILILKQYFGHMRIVSDASNVIKTNEEMLHIENGRRKHHMDIRESEKILDKNMD